MVTTHSGFRVEGQASWAHLLTREDSVHTNVELLAIDRVGVQRVGLFGTIFVVMFFGGASETVSQYSSIFITNTVFAGRVLRPDADACGCVENQTTGTGEVVSLSVDARKDTFASLGLEETVSAWAITNRSWGLKCFTAFAVNEVWQITFVIGAFEWIENKTIFAEFLFGNTLGTYVVFVALSVILILKGQASESFVFNRWAHKRGGCRDGDEEKSCSACGTLRSPAHNMRTRVPEATSRAPRATRRSGAHAAPRHCD